MFAGGWGSSGQKPGRGGEGHGPFPQQSVRVLRARPLARFPRGGLQAQSAHLEAEAKE